VKKLMVSQGGESHHQDQLQTKSSQEPPHVMLEPRDHAHGVSHDGGPCGDQEHPCHPGVDLRSKPTCNLRKRHRTLTIHATTHMFYLSSLNPHPVDSLANTLTSCLLQVNPSALRMAP